VLSYTGPVNVVLLHAPKVLQIFLLSGTALTQRFCSCSANPIVVTLRDGGRGNCGHSDPKGKHSKASVHGHHDEFPFGSVVRFLAPRRHIYLQSTHLIRLAANRSILP
jgi:hypothetical protein